MAPAASKVAAVATPLPGAVRLDDLIPRLMAQAAVPGLALAVVRQARLDAARAYGHKHADSREPVTPDTVFEAASLSKPLFAYAVLALCEEGGLDLDAPLTRYLPEPYVPGEPLLDRITARTVLCHTTGFQNWCWAEGERLAVHFEPGTRFGYSSAGYVYLQRAVERVTGQPLSGFMRRTLDALGMRHSSYVWEDAYESASATGHDEEGWPVPKSHPSEGLACASLHTTAPDYARFLAELLSPHEGTGLLSRAGVEGMLSPQVRSSEAVSWGLGWGLEHGPAGIGGTASSGTASGGTASGGTGGTGDCFWHWGDNGCFKAFALVSRSDRSGVVVFTNGVNGLTVCEPIVRELEGGEHPAFAWVADFYRTP